MHAFFDNLIDVIKRTTNVDCVKTDGVIPQSVNTIHYTNDDNGACFLIHEFCHFLAANHKNRATYNLGFPLFGENEMESATCHIMSELKTVYFTQLIFDGLISRCFDGVTGSDKDNAAYMCYLADIGSKHSMMQDLNIHVIENLNLDVWKRQLDRKLGYFGTDIERLRASLECHVHTQPVIENLAN